MSSEGLHGILEKQDLHCIDRSSPYIRAVVEKAPVHTEDRKLVKVNSLYFLFADEIYDKHWRGKRT